MFFHHRLHIVICALIEIASGLTTLATLTLYIPHWEMSYIVWYTITYPKRILATRLEDELKKGGAR